MDPLELALDAARAREQQALEALRLSERRLAETQEVAKIGSWELDFASNALVWSDQIFRIFELDPARFGASYEAFLQMVHPDDRDAVHDTYAASIADRIPYETVHRLLTGDGRVKYLREKGRTFYDEHGTPIRSMGTVQDITERVQAQQQMLAHQQRFRALIEHSADFIALLGEDGTFVYLSPAFERMLGQRVDEWLGQSAFPLVWPDDSPRARSYFAQSLSAPGDAIAWQLRLRHADGTTRWAEGTTTNWLADATIGGLVVNCRDITDRKRAEAAEFESVERLRQAVRGSHIGIFDHDHRTDAIYWSPEQRALYGVTADEPISLAVFLDSVHPDDALAIAAAVRHAHDPRGNGQFDVEHRIVRRDGTVRLVSTRSQTLFEGEGDARRPARTVGAVVDITERRVAEQTLRMKDAAIATSITGIAITDAVGRLIYANPAFVRMWGYRSEQEVVGKTPLDLGEPTSTLAFVEQLRTHGTWQGELVARRKDGSTFDIMLSASCVIDAHGELVNMMGSFLDITESKRLTAQLLQAQKMESIGRLAGGVAHDFNNLLMVMSGYLELAMAGLDPGTPLYHQLSEVSRAAGSAADLTKQLLAFSRKQIVAPEVLDLNGVVQRVEKMLRRLLGEDIELRTDLAPDLGPVRFDPAQAEQMLINLAANARDAMPGGGTLAVTTANVRLDDAQARRVGLQPGGYVRLEVSDTGTGMSDDVQAHLFEPFFTTKDPGKGTGLGLATIYGAVTQGGGGIEVTSRPARGTTFAIYLPIVTDAGDQPRQARPTGVPRGTESIVLVEDDDDVRALAKVLLERLGYQVRAFPAGAAAIAGVRDLREPVHLLMTDIVMPGMNGRVLAEHITAMQPDIRVLFTSGYTSDAIVHRGILDDGIEFLAKPYTLAELAQHVRNALGDRPAR